MSSSASADRGKCVSCGINIAGMAAAQFACPACNTEIVRCTRCRKQSNLYACPSCEFTGP